MKKTIATLILSIACAISYSQQSIEGLVQAERNFAAYSVEHGTKAAFLKFLDSTGIVFENGKPVNGIETWLKREDRPVVLNWRPLFAGISASGDFGYTTGPWTLQRTINDTIVTEGRYTTVWHINKNGEWKFLIDLGVQNTPHDTDTSSSLMSWMMTPANNLTYSGSHRSLLKAEEDFIKKTQQDLTRKYSRKDTYKETLSGNWTYFVLNRNRRLPPQDGDPVVGTINEMPKEIQYTIGSSAISSAGDMGYVYGTTVINGKTDNYLRIWRRESSGWKLAVEVLRF